MDIGERIRTRREQVGLSQIELAASVGMSRQTIGAIEAGKNLPRVDAAIALAGALGVEVSDLFTASPLVIDVITGELPQPGPVHIGRVDDRLVSTPVRARSLGYEPADLITASGDLETLTPLAPGLVVAGCEPGLGIVERLLREGGVGAMWVATSSKNALLALDEGRAHAAVVHGTKRQLRDRVANRNIERLHLATWRVGLSAGEDDAPGWQERALSGSNPVVQRESGAVVQRVFLDALSHANSRPPGPVADGHLESAQRGLWTGIPAVTFEPAAIAVDRPFHELAVHNAQIWIPHRFRGETSLTRAIDLMMGQRFGRHLEGIGGYDLSQVGTKVA